MNVHGVGPNSSLVCTQASEQCPVQKSAEKSQVYTAHLPELATALYEAFALHAKAIQQSRDTQIRCAILFRCHGFSRCDVPHDSGM
jgi:hypothetical protein